MIPENSVDSPGATFKNVKISCHYSQLITPDSLWVRLLSLAPVGGRLPQEQKGGRGDAGRSELVRVGTAHQPLHVRERKGKCCALPTTAAGPWLESAVSQRLLPTEDNARRQEPMLRVISPGGLSLFSCWSFSLRTVRKKTAHSA